MRLTITQWRRLALAEYGTEIAALLLDAKWTIFRGRIGGLLVLKTDFEILDTFFD